MSNPFPPEAQQRLRVLYHYVQALEHGDLERVANLLRLAEQDGILDRMFQEIDLLYQVQDQMTVQPDELSALQERLAHLYQQESDAIQLQPSTARTWIPQRPAVFPFRPERRQTSMNTSSTPFIPEEQEERGMSQAQPPSRRRRVTRFSHMLAAVLVAVVLVGGLIGTLQLTRQHLTTSTSVGQRGNATVFQGGPYLIQANSNGDGNPNADATVMLPNLSLAPSWSYAVTMTKVRESITPQYGDLFGLILGYTQANAYAVTFASYSQGPSISGFNYNWSVNHQRQAANGDPIPGTPVPGGIHAWDSPNPAPFHTGLNVANTVKITATAHTLTIFVNGVSVGTINNLTVGPGQFGMFVDTKGTAVTFQHVQITRL